MKIIQIMDNLNVAGGVNSFVYDLCVALKDVGQDVTLIGILGDLEKSKTQAIEVREAGIPVYCLCMPGKKQAIAKGIPKLKALINEISGGKPTVCNLHLKLSVLMGGLATIGLKNVKCVETYHSQYSHYSLEYNLMKGRISKYIPCSDSAGREMQEKFHVPERKLKVIPNGINADLLRRIAGSPDAHNGIQILSVGRMTKQKNYPVTVEAFTEICNELLIYQIIGEGEDRLKLEALSKDNHNIRFFGTMSREEVVKHTNNADLIVMPSLWEGLSIYLMEAMSLGKPLILSNIPSFTDTIGERTLSKEETWRCCSWGYLVDTNNVNAYREAVLHFNVHKELWDSMRQYVLRLSKKYDIKGTASSYLKAYHGVMRG